MNRKYEVTENLDRLDARIVEQWNAHGTDMKGIDTAVFEVLGEINDALFVLTEALDHAGVFDDDLDRLTRERREMLVTMRETVRDTMGDYFTRYCSQHWVDFDSLLDSI